MAIDTSVFRGLNPRGVLAKSIDGQAGGTVTLTVDEAKYRQIVLTGAVSATPVVAFPNAPGMEWLVDLTGLTTSDGTLSVYLAAGGLGFYAPVGEVFAVYVGAAGLANIATPSEAVGGLIYADRYADLQSAIDATPAFGTLFLPAGDYATLVGFTRLDKPINIIGTGRASRLVAGAAGITLLALSSPAGATVDATFTRFCHFADFALVNAAGFADVTLLKLTRCRRNSFRNLHLDGIFSGINSTGIDLRSVWISTFESCYIDNCTVGIETRNYTPADGVNTSLRYFGGMIENCNYGVQLLRTQMDTFVTTIEACSVAGIYADGVSRLVTDGCYWENHGTGAFDVMLAGTWRDVRIDNADRIDMQGVGSVATITNFRDNSSNQLNIASTVQEVLIINPWWNEQAGGNLDSLQDIVTAVQQGRARLVHGGGEPKGQILPGDLAAADNLLANGEMANGAAGWGLANMAAETVEAPFGTLTSVATSSVTPGDTCIATRAMDAPFSNELRDRLVTLSAMVKVPDATWGLSLVLLDGVRNKALPITDAYKTGSWEHVAVAIRADTLATGLSWRVSVTVGASGTAYVSLATLALGNLPRRAQISRFLAGAQQSFPCQRVAAVVSLAAADQIDPCTCGVQTIQGSGGAVTSTAAPFFSNSANWHHGQIAWLLGNSDANTVTFTSGASSNLRLGSATRTLRANTLIGFLYWASTSRWIEIFYGGAANAGANADITALSGITGGVTGSGGLHVAGAMDGNTGPFTLGVGTQAMADANQTPVVAVYKNPLLVLTGALTAQRDLILPTTSGADWTVDNQCTGAGVRVKTSGGSGIVIATARLARVRADGTNIRRVTADVDPTV